MEAYLERFCDTSEQGVFGTLKISDEEFYTVERPWLDNEEFISCIPPGEYVCKRVVSPKFGITFEVTDVEDRTHILFHVANTLSDLKGCIGLGSSLGYVDHRWAVTNSKNSVRRFMNLLYGENEFNLTIAWKHYA